MGLVGTIRASGLLHVWVDRAKNRMHSVRHGEAWISGAVGAAVMLTTHSIVAILMVSDFVNKTGKKMNIGSIRRANLLSLVVCIFPFLLPYFIPVILMANMTSSGQEFDIPSVAPIQVGLYNFVSWALFLIVIFVVAFGYGRDSDNMMQVKDKSTDGRKQ